MKMPMKKIMSMLLTCLIFFLVLSQGVAQEELEVFAANIQWFGQGAVKIVTDNKVIYIDPFNIKTTDRADIVLITHPHSDHLSEKDLKKVATGDTIFITPNDQKCKNTIQRLFNKAPIALWPGTETTIDGIRIQAVPAYNVVKSEKHPMIKRWVGYILTINGIRVYHAGDTELIPEMKTFSCDIALMPLGQTYTMSSVKMAAKAVQYVGAKIAIPIHYGMYEGTEEDAEEFKQILEDLVDVEIKVIIKEIE